MALQALWDVTQQFNHKNGSILTSGKIYIYYQGRTTLATTYHDEDGTVVNSNPILLDNNGRATAFADPIYSYTIVVCDFYGKELFSQDITLHDAISTAEDVVIVGSNGTVLVDRTELANGVQYDLSANTDILATKEEISTKKDKQIALSFDGAATKTVKKITQNANGEITVEYEDIALVPNVEITSEDNSVQITETTDDQTNTKTFDISVNTTGQLEYGQFRATNVTAQAQITKIKGNLDLGDKYSINLKKGSSYHFTIRGNYVANSAENTSTTISYIEYSTLTPIDVNVDNTIADPQYFEISYDVYNYGQNSPYNVAFSTMTNGKISELWVEVHGISGSGVSGTVSNIVIAREYNDGVLDDAYDGMKIMQTDNSNEIIALRKNTTWSSFGQLAPLSAGSDKILITDSLGTAQWGVVGTGLEIDNNTLEVQISGEVGDVVAIVEKLQNDLDKKITTTYPFAQITSMGDFATYGVTNTTRMIGQLFAVPISSEIRKDDTVLCVNALQNFSGNVSFGIFEYDFEGNNGTGSTYWIADTGTVSVRAGENEFALKYVLNNAHELQSSKLYYAVIAIDGNAPVTGLLLGSSSSYEQNVNANPKYTIIVSNMNNYVDWSVGTLQGAWFQGYNEQYDIPRLFMMLRNGEESIPVTQPFTDIGGASFTLEQKYTVSDIFSLTPDALGGVYRKIIPAQDVDIASFRYIDCHDSVNYSSSFPVLLDDTYLPLKTQSDVTWTDSPFDDDSAYYVHEFTFTTSPVHLTANTAYWFVVGANLTDQGSDLLVTYKTPPSVTNDLLLVKNMYNVNSWIIPASGEFVASQPGMYLRLSDGTNSWTV